MAHGTTKSIQWLWIAVFFLFVGQVWMNERENLISYRLDKFKNDMKKWKHHHHHHKHYYDDQSVYQDEIIFQYSPLEALPWNTPAEKNGKKKKKNVDRKESLKNE